MIMVQRRRTDNRSGTIVHAGIQLSKIIVITASNKSVSSNVIQARRMLPFPLLRLKSWMEIASQVPILLLPLNVTRRQRSWRQLPRLSTTTNPWFQSDTVYGCHSDMPELGVLCYSWVWESLLRSWREGLLPLSSLGFTQPIAHFSCYNVRLSTDIVEDTMWEVSRLSASLAIVLGVFFCILLISTVYWESINMKPVAIGLLVTYLLQSFSFFFYDSQLCREHSCKLSSGTYLSIFASFCWFGASRRKLAAVVIYHQKRMCWRVQRQLLKRTLTRNEWPCLCKVIATFCGCKFKMNNRRGKENGCKIYFSLVDRLNYGVCTRNFCTTLCTLTYFTLLCGRTHARTHGSFLAVCLASTASISIHHRSQSP